LKSSYVRSRASSSTSEALVAPRRATFVGANGSILREPCSQVSCASSAARDSWGLGSFCAFDAEDVLVLVL